jgi:hypothetical protein
MRDDENDLTLRPGKIRSRRGPPTSFFTQVLRAVSKQTGGRFSAGANRNATAAGRSTFGRGRNAYGRSLFSSSSRRGAIKARIVRHRGAAFRSASMTKHIAYLQREGVAKESDRAVMFDASGEPANERAFVERCAGDRHHFRFIVAPEDAAEMTDLRAFARDLARQMELEIAIKMIDTPMMRSLPAAVFFYAPEARSERGAYSSALRDLAHGRRREA